MRSQRKIDEMRRALNERDLLHELKKRCRKYYVSIDDVLGTRRERHIVRARKDCVVFMHDSGLGCSSIARLLGLNHATVLYHINNPMRDGSRNEPSEA